MEYSYVNGCMLVHQDILPGYKRFNRCNAQWARFKIEYLDIIQFISYSTKILQIVNNTKYDTWELSIVDCCFDYSQTTNRQISKFLASVAQPFTTYDIRQAVKYCHSVTPDIGVYDVSDKQLIKLCSKQSLNIVWR